MAARRARKITIELRPVRAKISRATGQAKRSVKRGVQAIKKAIREGRLQDAAKNRTRLAKAKNAQQKLDGAMKLMNMACCNQRFNCDPDYV